MNAEVFGVIIKACVAVISVVLTTVIVPLIKAKIGESKWQEIQELTEYAVRCAEQIYSKEEWEQKKKYVYEYVVEKANAMGLKLDAKDIDLLVEGMVNEVKYY